MKYPVYYNFEPHGALRAKVIKLCVLTQKAALLTVYNINKLSYQCNKTRNNWYV